MKRLTVYYVPTCSFSAGTISFLLLRGADFRVVNLDENPAEKERIDAALGDRRLETPTLEVDGELLVAPSLSELRGLLESWLLRPAAAPHEQLKRVR